MLSAIQKALAFERIAELAPTLAGAEIKVLLALCSQADSQHLTATIGRPGEAKGLRTLADTAQISYSTVQAAIANLRHRQLITTRDGTATKGTTVALNFLRTASMGAPKIGAPPAPKIGAPPTLPAPESGPPLHLFSVHPAPEIGAPSNPLGDDHHAGGRVDFDSISDSIFDRVLKARPSHHSKENIEECRKWLHGYMCKFGTEPNPHPPDDTLCAQFLTIETWPVLQGLLYDLMAERQECYSKGWFITIGLQRLHGIAPQTQKARRAELRSVKRPMKAPPLEPGASERVDSRDFTQQLLAEVAKVKGARR